MQELLNINAIVIALTGTGIVGIGIKLYQAIKTTYILQEERFKNIENGMQSQLKNSLYIACKSVIEKKYVTFNELQNINTMYVNYKNLKGNSFIEDLIKRVEELEIKEGEI